MRNFLVNVNGTQYEVAVEEIDGKAAPAAKPAPAAPVAAPVVKTVAAAGGTKITAPMPGTILGVNVKEGEAVKAGQPIFFNRTDRLFYLNQAMFKTRLLSAT